MTGTPPAPPNAPLLVDSHCHLNFPDFKDDLDEVIARARAGGVRVMQTICTDMAEFDEVHAIAQRYEGVYCSVGVHPNESGATEVVSAEALIAKTASLKVIGIGETGLDYYYEHSDRASQRASFLAHIACARATGLPLIVHSRAADEDTIAILEAEMQKGSFTGVIHCFSSSKYLAEKAVELGFYISLAGIITFKKSAELREITQQLPINRLLVETDSPYLAPMPHRGTRNEPSYTRFTNRLLAELHGISEESCATHTTDNFFRLFAKARRPEAQP